MPWVRFNEDFNWKLFNGRYMKMFPRGYEGQVTQRCFEEARMLGIAEVVKRPANIRIDKSGKPYRTDLPNAG